MGELMASKRIAGGSRAGRGRVAVRSRTRVKGLRINGLV
jgi:hypothetical protein